MRMFYILISLLLVGCTYSQAPSVSPLNEKVYHKYFMFIYKRIKLFHFVLQDNSTILRDHINLW